MKNIENILKYFIEPDYIPCPDDSHKKYRPKDIMPYPKKNLRKISSFFKIDVNGEGDDLGKIDDTPLDIPDEEGRFQCVNYIRLHFNLNINIFFSTITADLYDALPYFLYRLEKEGYAYWKSYIYDNFFILAWKKKGRIRFMLFDGEYKEKIYVRFDKLIPEHIFYEEFERLKAKIQYRIDQRKVQYKEFKRLEKLLNSLDWEYERGSVNPACESALITESDDIIQFAEKVKQKQLSASTQEFAYFSYGKYDYMVSQDGKKLIRCLSGYPSLDVSCFIQNIGIAADKKTTLSLIIKQMFEQGWNRALSVEIGKKTLILFENGALKQYEEFAKLKDFVPENAEEAEKFEKFKQIFSKINEECRRKRTKIELRKLKNLLYQKGFYSKPYKRRMDSI